MNSTPRGRRRRTTAAGGRTGGCRAFDPLAMLMAARAFIALILLIIVFALQTDVYLSRSNLITMTKPRRDERHPGAGDAARDPKGGIDLSVGSTVGLSGVVAAQLLKGVEVRRSTSSCSRRCG